MSAGPFLILSVAGDDGTVTSPVMRNSPGPKIHEWLQHPDSAGKDTV